MVETSATELDALKQAIAAAGSQPRLARAIGVSSTSVWRMLHRAKRASSDYVLKIEAATGIPRSELRPDLYPVEDYPPRASAPPKVSP
jgi:DNA-binding transcriptional regulator YdaS (Cro superfamily)